MTPLRAEPAYAELAPQGVPLGVAGIRPNGGQFGPLNSQMGVKFGHRALVTSNGKTEPVGVGSD